jgi:hypothetical protein
MLAIMTMSYIELAVIRSGGRFYIRNFEEKVELRKSYTLIILRVRNGTNCHLSLPVAAHVCAARVPGTHTDANTGNIG